MIMSKYSKLSQNSKYSRLKIREKYMGMWKKISCEDKKRYSTKGSAYSARKRQARYFHNRERPIVYYCDICKGYHLKNNYE